MKKRSRILAMLLLLSMVLSPISLAITDINNAEDINVETMEVEETPFKFDEETGTITGYKGENPPSGLVIPEKINGVAVKHIGDNAFKDKKLNSVVLPEGLESLGYMAFQKNNFTKIELPSTLITLGKRSLAYNKLTTIEFPGSLKSIGEEAFQENEFTEIEIPSHIEEIQEGAFNNNKIEKITLYDGLKTIGGKAFHNNSIDEIIIPDTVDNWPTGKDDPVFRNNKKVLGVDLLQLAKVYNKSGATAKNTFGIVNPASVIIEYKDVEGRDLAPSKTIVGKELKKVKKDGDAWNAPIVLEEGSSEYLLNYDVDKDVGYKVVGFLDEISENYYQMNKEYIFEPEEIEDYPTPEAQTVTLNDKKNIITFTYSNEGEESEDEPVEDLTKPAKIELNFPGGKQVTPLYPGGKQIVQFKVFNGNDEEVNGEKVTFESSNPDVLKHSFSDTFTAAGEVKKETEVTITAILKSNEEIKGEIKVTVTPKVEEPEEPEENKDEKYIQDAIKKLKGDWFKLKINSDHDTNVNLRMESELNKKGFGDIKVSVKSSDKEQYIDLNGDINYRYDEKYFKYGLKPTEQVALTFEFSKGEAEEEYEIRTVVGWDRAEVRQALQTNIIEPMSGDLIGENESFDKIKEDFEVPARIKYTGISWESSDESVLKIQSNNYGLDPSDIKVIRGKKDQYVTLTAKVKFNHDDAVVIEKKYNLTVLALENSDNTEESMQKLLDENYNIDKLKDSTNKKAIDPSNVVNDIQLIRPRDTEIKDYDDYRFKVTSDNDAVVIKNNPITYRANVYRPLPGKKTEEVNLTVNMTHKEKDIIVSKVIPIKVTPLTQEEIDKEIELMELTKENYFEGIKGDNESPEEIISNLKSFREANLVDGDLVWTYHIDNDKNTGIYPDELEGWENQEKWRIFKSSNPEIITHENLLVKRPKTNTDVKIESTLSSQVYGKYAVRYPEREDFQKLYIQDVFAEVTVIGEESIVPADLDKEIDFLKQCYEEYMKEDRNGNTGSAGLSMIAPGAARLAGMDVEDIQKHLYIDEKNESSYQLSQSIITLIGADLDPRQYKDKTGVRNLVQELVDLQEDSGKNQGEFVGTESDRNSVEAQVRSIIALDMAGADYDKAKSVSKLMDIYDKKGDSHTYKAIKTEGIVLIALSNHKNIDGVEDKVVEILNYLKTQQNKDGGFDIKSGHEKGTNSPTATGRVIQGLIANGINPLTDEEWIKNGSTILDAIVKSKTVKDNMKHSGYGRGVEDKYTYYEATATAFGGLIDLKNQKSMFDLLKLKIDTDEKPTKVEIVKLDSNQIEAGNKVALTAKVYDEDDKLLQGKELIWTSSDENIINIKNGNMEAKKAGKATITVTVKGTEIKDVFDIIVIEEIKTLEVNTSILVFDKNGEYEIKSEPQKVTIDKKEHDGKFTAFGALQATTSEYVGAGGWITAIYGIEKPKDGNGGWMFTVNGKIPNVGATQVELKEGDKVIWFCTYDYETDKAPTWKDLTGEEPEEELTVKIIADKRSVKVGEELPLVAEVRKGDTLLKDQEIMWLSSNAEIATIEYGKLIAHKAGEVNITAALVENKDIKDTISIKVAKEDEKELTIEEVVEALREHYSNKDKFTFREAIGYNYTSENLEEDLVQISSKFKTNEEPETTSEHVGNIIGLIAGGENPYNYNNKNYVETLVKSQDIEGKFLVKRSDNYSTVQAFAVMALDMADAEYNKDKAVEALLSYQIEDGSFGGVDETGMVLTALGKYKEDSKVQIAIEKALDYLKEEQDGETGGFVVWGSENPYSASAVLQGLIAVGEDPFSEKWTKDEKTIVDSLMNFYKDGYLQQGPKSEIGINMLTEQGFIALADVYRGKSMFNEIKFNRNEPVKLIIDKPTIDKITEGESIKLYARGYDKKGNIVAIENIIWTSSDKNIAQVDKNGKVTTKGPGKVTITAKLEDENIETSIELEIQGKELEIEYIGDTEVKNGQQANANIKMKNLTKEVKPATLIVTLYDKKTNKLLNYSIIKRELKSQEEIELSAGFLVPDIGEYQIKVFLWDGLEHQNIIMEDAKEIKIAN